MRGEVLLSCVVKKCVSSLDVPVSVIPTIFSLLLTAKAVRCLRRALSCEIISMCAYFERESVYLSLSE